MSIRVEKVDVSDEKNHIIIFDTLNQYATDLMGGILIIIISTILYININIIIIQEDNL